MVYIITPYYNNGLKYLSAANVANNKIRKRGNMIGTMSMFHQVNQGSNVKSSS